MKNEKMVEHEKTISIIRMDYMEQIDRWFIEKYSTPSELAYYSTGYDWRAMLENCTTLQLRAFCKLIDRDLLDLKLLPCNPFDHMAVSHSGIYVGIEIDGYCHS